jgi:hypothetical protein
MESSSSDPQRIGFNPVLRYRVFFRSPTPNEGISARRQASPKLLHHNKFTLTKQVGCVKWNHIAVHHFVFGIFEKADACISSGFISLGDHHEQGIRANQQQQQSRG